MGSTRFDFDGDTVIVTGASSGIGRAIATRFGEAGATVLVADHSEDPKAEDAELTTHELIEEAGGDAAYVETDLSNYNDIENLMTEAREYGGVDVLVNNAAVQHPEDFRTVSPDALDKLYGVNVRGMFFGTQVAANDMIERGVEGNVVNVASISSEDAQHDQVQYDATKGAIKMLTRGAALELAEYGVRVNAVAPGQIATEFEEGWSEEAQRMAGEGGEGFIKPVPLGRAGFPEDCAGPTLFLASEDAGYVTGELFYVDGGWTAI
ncbi:SDR family NAD(P)-dependent oxidoreductase [Halobium salinum]|uniref:SDR family NAD(P)-dependent oxidoreductase n=1 Tax=Halobium salinum TaxID=1364940 RepID=A0ABD5PAU8_9EURY|nr:SDR family oxidoreductase [Halobium salinum]